MIDDEMGQSCYFSRNDAFDHARNLVIWVDVHLRYLVHSFPPCWVFQKARISDLEMAPANSP